MYISELIKKLEEIKEREGDLKVCKSEKDEYWGSTTFEILDYNVEVSNHAQPEGPKSGKCEKSVVIDQIKLNKMNERLKKIKDWFYNFKNGHPFLLNEEVDIIYATRFDDRYKWMSDSEIKELIKFKVKEMYKKKFPKAKPWRFS